MSLSEGEIRSLEAAARGGALTAAEQRRVMREYREVCEMRMDFYAALVEACEKTRVVERRWNAKKGEEGCKT